MRIKKCKRIINKLGYDWWYTYDGYYHTLRLVSRYPDYPTPPEYCIPNEIDWERRNSGSKRGLFNAAVWWLNHFADQKENDRGEINP